MKVAWDKKEQEGGNAGKAYYYITDLVSDNAAELCKKAVPTGEETGSKKNKAKARSWTIPDLKQNAVQMNNKLVEFGLAEVAIPKKIGEMRKVDWEAHEGAVRRAYDGEMAKR